MITVTISILVGRGLSNLDRLLASVSVNKKEQVSLQLIFDCTQRDKSFEYILPKHIDLNTEIIYFNRSGKQPAMRNAGLDNIKISMYDGPEQIEYFTDLRDRCNLIEEQFAIRPRYLSEDENFGLIFKNSFLCLSKLNS